MQNISFLIDYHVWAHNRILHQLQTITMEEWNKDLGGSFPTMRELSKHLITADYRWMQRWKGVPFADIPGTFVFDSCTQVNATWQPIFNEMQAVAKAFFEGGAEQPINFITSSGKEFTMPFWQTVYQVVNHGTYHRGQITNMLRLLHKDPVATDIFLFFVEKDKQ